MIPPAGARFDPLLVVLGAGASLRMGRSKLLLPWGDSSVLGHILAQWAEAGVPDQVVVTAPGAVELEAELARLPSLPVRRIINPEPGHGMFRSIQEAARQCPRDAGYSHVVLSLGDQPQIRAGTLRILLDSARSHPDRIVQPSRNGRPRHPVVFPSADFAALGSSAGPTLREHLQTVAPAVLTREIDDPGLDVDLDTPSDYARWHPPTTGPHPRRAWVSLALGALLVLSSAPNIVPCSRGQPIPAPDPAGTLSARIVDARTRKPLEATVSLIDAEGKPTTRGAGLPNAFRVSGEFEARLRPGSARLRVTRGPEYLASESRVDIREGAVSSLEITLERQVDLRRRGWHAGDSHAHMLHGERTVPVTFDDVALAARAEDLQLLSVAQAWAVPTPTPEVLEAELTRRSHPDHVLTWNLEAPKNYYLGDAGRCLGHCWTLGMRGRTPDGGDVIARLLEASAWDYESGKAPVANFESHALIRAQGGAVFYTHPARWWTGPWGGAGGYPRQAAMRVSNMAVELPFDVLAGPTFDGLDVITGAGEVEANEKAFRLWALLLNHGYRVAATASSDACFDRPGGAVPGAARLYAHVDGPFGLETYTQAVVEGRTVATTGPLLIASLDGKPPGRAHPVTRGTHVLTIEAWASGASTGGLARIEVLRRGELFRVFEPSPPVRSLVTNLTLAAADSGWFCVRVFGEDRRTQRAISGAFFIDETPWRAPEPVPARIEVDIVDRDTGHRLDAVVTEIVRHGARPRGHGPAETRRHRLPGGHGQIEVPATVRLQAEAEGYSPVTLSPLFDQPALLERITRMDDRDLLDWTTFEDVRARLARGRLTFRLQPVRP